MQRVCIIILLALIWHETLQQEGGRNDGEPDYDSEELLESIEEVEGINGGSNNELNHRQRQCILFEIVDSKDPICII